MLLTGRLSLRRAERADIPAMSDIRLSVRENILSDPSRVTLQMYEDYLEAAGRGWVAEFEGKIVGFCYASRHDASIWALFVRPGFEGRGIAQGLLPLAVDWLFGLGVESVKLSTGTGTRADRFYAAQGWRRAPLNGREVEYVLPNPSLPLS